MERILSTEPLSIMDTEERPNKLRKLANQAQDVPESEAAAPLLQQQAENATLESENSKPQEHAANNADAPGINPESSADVELQPETQTEIRDPPTQNGEHAEPLSKNQLKKLRKQQEWEAGRDYRKAKRKQKTKERRQRRRDAREEEEAQQQTGVSKVQTTTQYSRSRRPVVLPVTILIDCGFDDLMMEKERISLGSQLTRSYSDNWRAPFQTHLVFSSWGGLLKERFDTVLRKHYLNWKGVTFEKENFMQAAQKAKEVMRGPDAGTLSGIFQPAAAEAPDRISSPKVSDGKEIETLQPSTNAKSPPPTSENGTAPSSITATTENVDSAQHQAQLPLQTTSASPPSPDDGEIIYLTSDSPNTLSTLRPYSTYIVGGLVDKNRHKGICYRMACEQGVKTAKLPIGEYLEMQSRKVLTTNHVVEIMIRYLECGDWGEAFLKVIPKRKGGRLREKSSEEGLEDEDDDDDDDAEDDDEGHDRDEVRDHRDPVLGGESDGGGRGAAVEASGTSNAQVETTS